MVYVNRLIVFLFATDESPPELLQEPGASCKLSLGTPGFVKFCSKFSAMATMLRDVGSETEHGVNEVPSPTLARALAEDLYERTVREIVDQVNASLVAEDINVDPDFALAIHILEVR